MLHVQDCSISVITVLYLHTNHTLPNHIITFQYFNNPPQYMTIQMADTAIALQMIKD